MQMDSTSASLLFENIFSIYGQFPDRSDFIPVLLDGEIVVYYYGANGLNKAKALEFQLGSTIKIEETSQSKIYELLEDVNSDIGEVLSDDENVNSDDSNILASSYDDAPIIKLVNQIIIYAVRNGASDIHFEGKDSSFIVRLRIDGVLSIFKKYPKSLHEPMVARTKVISALDVSETRKTQDGRINLRIGNRNVDLRVSTIPSINGEKVVLRILEQTGGIVDINNIGMNNKQLGAYIPYLSRPNGIILVTGPTGSGKTTTLYASLLAMDREHKNILTIEDPVEYHIDNITQVQVNSAANITFANAIRAFLRQDPDVILVGEIRDEVTAQTAIQASLTGHLVLSTLHTNDAPTTISRLIEMNVEPFLLSSSLSLVIAQRLVRKNCLNCSKTIRADNFIKALFKENSYDINSYSKGEGCDMCYHTGYKGRTGIYEIFPINDSIRSLINAKASANEIKNLANKLGYHTMFDHGVELVKSGITTPEELLSVTRAN